MTPRPLRPPRAAAHAALLCLAACSGGSSPAVQDAPPADPPPDEPACAAVLEGTWSFVIESVVEFVELENGTLTQNGCLVFFEKGDWRLSGTLLEDQRWSVEIVFEGVEVGHFAGTFMEDLGSPLYLFLAELDGRLDGEPLVAVTGRWEPAGLALSGVTPPSGTLLGGTEVEVSGGGFLDFELQFVFGGQFAEVLEKTDDGSARVRTPPAVDMQEGPVDVTVLTSDFPGGEATASETLQEAYTYTPCSNLAPGEWTLALEGAPRAATPAVQDCVLSFDLAVAQGAPAEELLGPLAVDGTWTLDYLIGGALAGTGTATLSGGDPASALVGSIALEGGGTLTLSGQAPPPEEPGG